MIPARYFKENFILVRNITVEIVDSMRMFSRPTTMLYRFNSQAAMSQALFLLDSRLMIFTGRWAAAEL